MLARPERSQYQSWVSDPRRINDGKQNQNQNTSVGPEVWGPTEPTEEKENVNTS